MRSKGKTEYKTVKWNYNLFKAGGVQIRMNATFILLLLWVGASTWISTHQWVEALGNTVFIVALFICVVLHEGGHALAARRYGIRTLDITLLPIGGLARLECMPEKSSEEIVIALAGPAVNLVIAAFLFIFVNPLSGSWHPHFDLTSIRGFVASLALVNIQLAVFNLIPAFPMDGGRVLRAILALFKDRERATRWATFVSSLFSIAFITLGFFYSPMLMLIGGFIFIASRQELQFTRSQDLLRGLTSMDAVTTGHATLQDSATIGDATDAISRNGTHRLLVLRDNSVIGVLDSRQLMDQAMRCGLDKQLKDCELKEPVFADPEEDLIHIQERLQAAPAHTVIVRDPTGVRGIIDLESLYWLSWRSKLKHV